MPKHSNPPDPNKRTTSQQANIPSKVDNASLARKASARGIKVNVKKSGK
jgi:hypothetical protein